MSQTPIIPTIGRVVLVAINGQIAPGLVNYVSSQEPDVIEAAVLTRSGIFQHALTYHETDEVGGAYGDFTWHWMPYQKAVATGETLPNLHEVATHA